MLDKEKTDDKNLFKRLIIYLKPHKKQFIFALCFILITSIIELIPPLLIAKILEVISTGDKEIFFKVLIYGAIFLGALILALFLNYKQSLLLQEIGEKIILKIRLEVFETIEKLSLNQLNDVPVGKLVTRVMNDPDSISQMFTSTLINLIRSFLMMIIIVVILFILNYKLALIALSIIPFMGFATFIFRKLTRKSYARMREEVSLLNAFLSENLSGIKITQIFNQEEKKREEFRRRSRSLEKTYQKDIIIFSLFRPLIYLLSMVGLILVLYFGGKDVILGVFSFALLYSFYEYLNRFFNPIQEIAEEFNNLQNAFASSEKIFSTLNMIPTIVDDKDAISLDKFEGNVEFKNVWFSYLEGEWVLKDVSFKVLPGETIALVGATGSGKTTILSLLVRNYDVTKGEILLDGINIKKIKKESIRKHIGQMLQDVFLFNQTISQNITLNNQEISKEEVINSANYVGANTFIEKLPDKYDHMVLERGNNFSSGQRQLISFARTLVYKPSFLILDEATANIDSQTEEIIQNSLKKIMKSKTMVIVAHRLSTIQYSNKIILLHKGEIKEVGNHQELLNLKGMYYNLYKIQFNNN